MPTWTAIGSCSKRLLAASCAVACATALALASPPKVSALEPCGKAAGYSYAGLQSADRAHGIRATVMALAEPQVKNGHVAAWVGVGGPGLGPNGSDQWLQVGISAVHGVGSSLYYEVATGGGAPRYHELAASITPGQRHSVAVLEVAKRPDWWRVWVNGKPASAPIHLPGSGGRFQPIATAETWDGGARTCNRFAYRFAYLRVAAARGGSWERFVPAHRFEDRGYRVTASASSFVAAAR